MFNFSQRMKQGKGQKKGGGGREARAPHCLNKVLFVSLFHFSGKFELFHTSYFVLKGGDVENLHFMKIVGI